MLSGPNDFIYAEQHEESAEEAGEPRGGWGYVELARGGSLALSSLSHRREHG
jgi:hypothetical protein